MALTRRVAKVDQSASGRVAAGPASKRIAVPTAESAIRMALPDVELATEANDPSAGFFSQTLWLYGEPGSGKTTFANQFPKPHGFMFEPGALWLPTHQKPVTHWLEWVAYHRAFAASDFLTGICDGMEDAFDLCFRFMCDEVLKIDHPSDQEDYGKSWNAIYTEYVSQMVKFISIPGKAKIFISHAGEKKFSPAFGPAYEMLRPSLGSKPLDRLRARVDVLGYMYHDDATNQNMMRVRGTQSIMAKVRPTDFFLYRGADPSDPNENDLVDVIPLGSSAKRAYAAYKAAFENKLERPAPVKSGLVPASKPAGLVLKKKS